MCHSDFVNWYETIGCHNPELTITKILDCISAMYIWSRRGASSQLSERKTFYWMHI